MVKLGRLASYVRGHADIAWRAVSQLQPLQIGAADS